MPLMTTNGTLSIPNALKAALTQARQFIAQHGRLGLKRRREDHDTLARNFAEHAGDVVVEGALLDAPAVFGAPLLAVQSPEQAGIVGDLGDRRDGAAR